MLWRKKPRWVKHPAKVRGDWVQSIAAVMYMTSGQQDSERWLLRDFGAESEMSRLADIPSLWKDAQTEKYSQLVATPVAEVEETISWSAQPPKKCYTAPTSTACGMPHPHDFIRLDKMEEHEPTSRRATIVLTNGEDENAIIVQCCRSAGGRLRHFAMRSNPANLPGEKSIVTAAMTVLLVVSFWLSIASILDCRAMPIMIFWHFCAIMLERPYYTMPDFCCHDLASWSTPVVSRSWCRAQMSMQSAT